MPHFFSHLKDKVVEKVTEQLGHTSLNDQQQGGPSGSSSSGYNYNNYNNYSSPPPAPPADPPAWAPAPETSHQWGKYSDAPSNEFEDAEKFCSSNPPHPPRLISSKLVDHINNAGSRAWGFEHPNTPRFSGMITNLNGPVTSPSVGGHSSSSWEQSFLNYSNPNYSSVYEARLDASGGKAGSGLGVVKISAFPDCKDVCLLSDLPIMAGLYDIQGKRGVYYEVKVLKMKGTVAVGTSCRPYPVYRLPGWNRLSAGFHLDDFRKFFEDPDGGRDYVTSKSYLSTADIPYVPSPLPEDSVIGCGYEFATGILFYTYQGQRLPPAFTGIYMPRNKYDVFAAIGIQGETSLEVNFGAESFVWKEGNEWAWKVEGHLGKMAPPQAPPSFSEAVPAAPPVAKPVDGSGVAPPPAFPTPTESRPIQVVPPTTTAAPSTSTTTRPRRTSSPEPTSPVTPPTINAPPTVTSEPIAEPSSPYGSRRPRQEDFGYGFDSDEDDLEAKQRRRATLEAGRGAGGENDDGEANRHLFAPPAGVRMQNRYDAYGYEDDHELPGYR
ncbi:hypothetical protein AX16_005290 [Volvariella volvacea WC 439]|nr:hypothetical protein AX16_005290 [Volvariella volvacea WC 439]